MGVRARRKPDQGQPETTVITAKQALNPTMKATPFHGVD
jgi:hypothetical protein